MKNHWIDNADSYICPKCYLEVNNPAKYEGCKCPNCGFQDPKDATPVKKTYENIRQEIINFLNANRVSAYDLVRVGKDLCNCRTCKFFVQHYDKDGSSVDFGHCRKNNIPKPRRPHYNSCGFWALDEET